MIVQCYQLDNLFNIEVLCLFFSTVVSLQYSVLSSICVQVRVTFTGILRIVGQTKNRSKNGGK